MTDAFTTALIAELGKKTGVCWLRYGGETRAAWHVWVEETLGLVSGGAEQPLPGIDQVERVEVLMRSKENGGRLVTWVGQARRVHPGDDAWEPLTTALLADRLNLDDLSTAVDEWAARSVVTQITPTGELVEQPGSLSSDSHADTPAASDATTRGPLPKVLHRRVVRRPRLS